MKTKLTAKWLGLVLLTGWILFIYSPKIINQIADPDEFDYIFSNMGCRELFKVKQYTDEERLSLYNQPNYGTWIFGCVLNLSLWRNSESVPARKSESYNGRWLSYPCLREENLNVCGIMSLGEGMREYPNYYSALLITRFTSLWLGTVMMGVLYILMVEIIGVWLSGMMVVIVVCSQVFENVIGRGTPDVIMLSLGIFSLFTWMELLVNKKEKKSWWWFLATMVLVGLSVASKLTGGVFLLAEVIVGLVYGCKKRWKFSEVVIKSVGLVVGTLFIFTLVNPFIISNPVRGISDFMGYRLGVALSQMERFPEYAIVGWERIFVLGKMIANYDGVWQAIFQRVVGIFVAGGLFVGGIIEFLKQMRRKQIKRENLIGFMMMELIIINWSYLVLDWTRYYAHMMIGVSYFQVLGIRYWRKILYGWGSGIRVRWKDDGGRDQK